MFGIGKKKAPLKILLMPLANLYSVSYDEVKKALDENGLSIENIDAGNLVKRQIEPMAFAYTLVIWGIQTSKLSPREKQLLCSSFTSELGPRISSFSPNDGGDYLRSVLLYYNDEDSHGNSKGLGLIAFKFFDSMEIEPSDYMDAYVKMVIVIEKLIIFTADYLDKQASEFKFFT
jgi:hypothetical protein